MAGDWARRKAAEIQKAEEERKLAREAELNRNKRIRGEAPRVWDSLVAMLNEEVEEFGKITNPSNKLKFNQTLAEEVIVSSPDATLQVTYDGSTPAILYTVSKETGPTTRQAGSKGQFNFAYDERNDTVWLQSANGRFSTSAAAGHLLDMIV